MREGGRVAAGEDGGQEVRGRGERRVARREDSRILLPEPRAGDAASYPALAQAGVNQLAP